MAGEIGLAAAHYAETAIIAMQKGDTAAAIGALASIDNASWEALQNRFPGFPSPDQMAELSAAWQTLDTAAELHHRRRALMATVDDADVVTFRRESHP